MSGFIIGVVLIVGPAFSVIIVSAVCQTFGGSKKKKRLAFRGSDGHVRLIPPGRYSLPWIARKKTYPRIGKPSFWNEMTEAERDKLYEVYQEEGLEALHDAARFLDRSVWSRRSLSRKEDSVKRGRKFMEGR